MATSGEMVVRHSVSASCTQLFVTSDDVFIENHSDDTQEAQIAQQGPFNTNL